MTQKRRDTNSTEFGQWLRNQGEIDSRLGFVTTNIDFAWEDITTGLYMFIEEKRYGWMPKPYQISIFKLINLAHKNQVSYRGFHLLVFTGTSSEDGKTILDGREIERDDLIDFLRFRKDSTWYESHFPPEKFVRIIQGYIQD